MRINYGGDMSLEAIVFFDLLKRPISKDELNIFSSKKWRKFNVKDAELNDPQVPGSPIKVLFKGAEHFTFYDHYAAREFLKGSHDQSSASWLKVKKYAWLFRLVPFIRMVAVCNTLAFDAGKKDSDIDLFIVTARNRMFTTRLFLTFLCHIFGVRRHGDKISNRFCLSFFVSEENLDLSPVLIKPLDIYMLFWMRSLKILFGGDMLTDFFGENSWYRRYFPDAPGAHFKFLQRKSFLDAVGGFFEKVLRGSLGNILEKALENWQLKRAGAKMALLDNSSGTVISHTMLKFHDNDKREIFLEKWKMGLPE